MKLYLIRHGQAVVNLGNWETLETIDTPLTDLGRAQCTALENWLEDTQARADVLYASTLLRTQETAEYVSRALNLEVILDDRIREVGSNTSDGAPIPSMKLPKTYISNHPGQDPYRPQTDQYKGMESWTDARTRLARFIADLQQAHTGQTVYVVAHGGILGMMAENVLNTPPVRHAVIHTDNTGISHYEYEHGFTDMQWVLRYHNRVDHLVKAGVSY